MVVNLRPGYLIDLLIHQIKLGHWMAGPERDQEYSKGKYYAVVIGHACLLWLLLIIPLEYNLLYDHL